MRERSAKLSVNDGDGVSRDGIKWKLTRVPGVTPASLGDPLAATSYLLCIYDRTGGTPAPVLTVPIPSATGCGVADCWRAGRNSYRYRVNGTGRIDVRLQSKTGNIGQFAVATKGIGAFTPALPFVQDPALTVQLHAATGTCWGATFSAPAARNEPTRFRDTAD
jgi:hypothetical protein